MFYMMTYNKDMIGHGQAWTRKGRMVKEKSAALSQLKKEKKKVIVYAYPGGTFIASNIR